MTMKNLEKLGYSKDKTVDEVAVEMLIERIRQLESKVGY